VCSLVDPELPAVLLRHRLEDVFLSVAARGAAPVLREVGRHDVALAVRRLVQRAPDHPWTATEVAGRLAMSAATLRRRLAAEGTSYRELLRDERMARASVLLRDPRLGVAEVALITGYRSASKFSDAFRRATGRTPTDWRSDASTDPGRSGR
jgi:AraC-like DNA-binding protein